MGYLIDTDIILFSLKGDKTVNDNFRKHRLDSIFVSAITIGELTYGAEKSQQKEKNYKDVDVVKRNFVSFDISDEIMSVFGKLKAQQEKSGLVVADMDLQIAATAIYYNLTLVTNNTKHFSKIQGLKTENWKQAQPDL